MSTILVELCAGTASVSLHALARCRPLTGFMGSKRAYAEHLCGVLGVANGLDRVVLVDAGPWGDVWLHLRDRRVRRELCRILQRWSTRSELPELWPELLRPPPEDPAERIAQYLGLQSRSAGCIPVWWSAERQRWESPSGSRTPTAHAIGGIALDRRMKPRGGRKVGPFYVQSEERGLSNIGTLARRIEALERVDWSRVDVVHGRLQDFEPIPGSIVYFDPPYANAPRYAALCPRSLVLNTAQRHAQMARRVVVSEGVPLSLPGWRHAEIPRARKPEWLTIFDREGAR